MVLTVSRQCKERSAISAVYGFLFQNIVSGGIRDGLSLRDASGKSSCLIHYETFIFLTDVPLSE